MKHAAWLCVACWLAAGVGLPAENVVIENHALRAQWETGQGRMVSLVDKATGREFLDPAAALTAYAVQPSASGNSISGLDASAVRVSRQDAAVIIETEHRQPTPLRIRCRFWLEGETPCLLGRMSIASEQPLSLAAVRFPQVGLRLPFSGTGAEDCVLLPYCDGCLVRNPLAAALNHQLAYPGGASMQMMAAFDRAAGVCLTCRDSTAYTKKLCVSREKKTLTLAVSHLTPQTAATTWETPCDTALTTIHGQGGPNSTTWETAADVYRQWAVRQPWCRQTLAQRVASGDVPKWLTEPSLFYAFSLGGQNKDGTWLSRLSMVAQQAEAWRAAIGGPVTFMLMGWEKQGPWVTPDYFPPHGGNDAFRKATAQLHEKGHHTLVFLSGLRWTLHKEVVGKDKVTSVIDEEAEFNRRGRASAISDAQGNAILYGEPRKDVGQHAEICSSTPLAREILLGASQGCQAVGIDCVQADQIVGGGAPPCFHPQHGHPPGGGAWCARAMYDHFAAVRREGKARDANYAFSIEEPGEFFIPVLDTYHARDYQQNRWPRMGAGVLGVPLFTHVYHDYLHGYGGDSAYVSPWPSDVALYHQAMNLVCGKAAGVAVWTRWFDPATLHSAQRRLLTAHMDLWRGPAREFLVFGRRLETPPLAVPSIEITFSDKDGKTRRTMSFPAVLNAAWKSPDGRVGQIFAAISSKPVPVKIDEEELTLEPGQVEFRIQPADRTP